MKLKRQTKPWKIIVGVAVAASIAIPALDQIITGAGVIFGASSTLTMPLGIVVLLFAVTCALWLIRRLNYPMIEVHNEHIKVRGDKYPRDQIDRIQINESRGYANTIAIKLHGYQLHEIHLTEGAEDRDATRIYEFLRGALPEKQIERRAFEE